MKRININSSVKLFFLLLFASFQIANGQSISFADSLYSAGEFKASGKAYDRYFESNAGNAGTFYDAACTKALANEQDAAIAYLQKATEKGFSNFDWMQKDSDLKAVHAHAEWEAIVLKAKENKAFQEKDFDKVLQKQLESIYVKDQTLRQLLSDAEKKFGRGTEEMTFFWEMIAQQDHSNEAEVIQIIEEKGWPGTSLVGGKANAAVWLVIQHAPLEIQEKYLPLLRASALKRESQGNHLALLEDRINVRNGKPQIYGSQVSVDQVTGQQTVDEIFEPEYVNQRRAAVGLGPLETYLKNFGIEFDVPQKQK